MLSRKEVKNIAKLSRIKLSETEIEEMRKDLSLILNYVEKLKNIKIIGGNKKRNYIDLKNVSRDDMLYNDDFNDILKKSAPDTKDNYIKIKPVF